MVSGFPGSGCGRFSKLPVGWVKSGSFFEEKEMIFKKRQEELRKHVLENQRLGSRDSGFQLRVGRWMALKRQRWV